MTEPPQSDIPQSFTEIFERDCSYYLSIGMTWEQYWDGDVWMVKAFREADKLRMERMNGRSHLMGMYVYEALCDVSPLLHAFAKKGTKPLPYPDAPYEIFPKKESRQEQKDREEAERLQAKLYMQQMIRAGKNWGG